MAQLHKKFSVDQVKILFRSYDAGHISRGEIEQTLGIGKTRFFALLKEFREEPDTFSIDYQRKSKGRLGVEAEEKIRTELQRDKALVENKELPISGYNYAAINDRLKKAGISVSTTTIIKRAVQQGCYLPQRKKKDRHDREVITSAAGALIQHDASLHKWSPYALDKWTLITSLDDYTRMLLYADFVESETSWAHIQSAQLFSRAKRFHALFTAIISPCESRIARLAVSASSRLIANDFLARRFILSSSIQIRILHDGLALTRFS